MSSKVVATIDLNRPGKQVGHLRLPRSSNTSGWSQLTIPIGCIANGQGPTAAVLGGVHGDEPEGQVAALNLLREVEPEDVTGRLIVVPCLSIEASHAYTRLWPSGANLNRSFPGSPAGPLDEQLADYVSRHLIAVADVVVDIHSGGRTGLCLPWSEMHWVDDPDQRRNMVEGLLAWNTDWCVVYIDIAGTGLLVGEAERQGKIVVSTELGGGGHVTAAVHRLARSGLDNVLRRFGVLAGEPRPRDAEPRILMATELDDYLLAPESGLFETLVDLGEHVEVDQPVGRIHFLERPDREPEPIAARSAGTVCVVRAIATTQQGDNVVVIGRDVSREELL
jgi:N-alpha-acetyl-L-2,4-diaminobutyrate deacetylase